MRWPTGNSKTAGWCELIVLVHIGDHLHGPSGMKPGWGHLGWGWGWGCCWATLRSRPPCVTKLCHDTDDATEPVRVPYIGHRGLVLGLSKTRMDQQIVFASILDVLAAARSQVMYDTWLMYEVQPQVIHRTILVAEVRLRSWTKPDGDTSQHSLRINNNSKRAGERSKSHRLRIAFIA